MQKEVLITKVAETFGFGICTEDYQEVYIPSILIKTFTINEGERYDFVLRKNHHNKDVAWFASFMVDKNEQKEAAVDEPVVSEKQFDLKNAIHKAVERHGICTTIEICNFIADEFGHNIDTRAIGPYLEQLHKDRRIVRIGVTTHPDQKRAAFVMWATDVKTIKEYFDADE